MVFSGLLFIFLYLPFVLVIYYALPKRFRNFFLFIANLIFYGWGEPVLIFVMLISTVVNYIYGLLIEKFRKNVRAAKILLVTCVVLNISLLGFFKYAGFISEIISDILPWLSALPKISVPLPIGISFYTFQIMSYVIDVYRRETAAQRSVIAFGTYVALFPQLIAGPIVRYKDVAEQLEGRVENMDQITHGVKLFLVGLAKKVLIANSMSVLWESLLASQKLPQGKIGILGAWIGIIAFTFQIYFDFSGYSDMARGLGNMLGFEFLINFDYPYISKSITEFWRRWHISLGTWFREYVYIPLGGNRCGKMRMIFNLLVVWFLTGLWHGASWNFILWGLYFGIILIIEKLFLKKYLDKLPKALSHLYALILIVLGWVIFYFEDVHGMFKYIGTMFSAGDGLIGEKALTLILSYVPLLIAAAVFCTPLARNVYNRFKNARYMWLAETCACIVCLLLCTASLVSSEYNPFLYFRF